MGKSKKDLVGAAGVHFVVGELSRRGWIALPTIRNTQGIDILAVRDQRSVKIQVKTSNIKSRLKWPMNKKAVTLVYEDLFYVFVDLKDENERPDYFILPSKLVAEYVKHTHKIFVGKAADDSTLERRKKSSMRQFPNRHMDLRINQFKDAWDFFNYTLVFQYGSNMDESRINSEDRLKGDATFFCIAKTVEDYELNFTVLSSKGYAVADIIPKKDHSVWGIIYLIPDYLIQRDPAKIHDRKSLDAI